MRHISIFISVADITEVNSIFPMSPASPSLDLLLPLGICMGPSLHLYSLGKHMISLTYTDGRGATGVLLVAHLLPRLAGLNTDGSAGLETLTDDASPLRMDTCSCNAR